MLKLFNTLTRKIEEFVPLNPPLVTMYACGPTVYDYTHIGHLRKYIGDDILKRVLTANGYQVKHVMNITDVGHLVSDEDAGEDKMEKGAKQKNMTVWEVAKFFEDYFLKSTNEANIQFPSVVCRATEHVEEQIKLIHKLEKNGYTYKTDEAIYFDVTKFPNYTKLSGQKLEDKNIGARDEVIVDSKKKNPADFALWFFTVGRFANHVMRWPSPWGEGFPGWHIECSAMSMEYLGDIIDIHTGGIDHISVHHTNEIAQSEGVTGKQFVRYWVHHNHLLIEGEKMSKSKNNFFKLEDLVGKGFDPMSLRYLILTAHYRDELNFTWKSLEASQKALNSLREQIRGWKLPANSHEVEPSGLSEQSNSDVGQFWHSFMESANNDLNTPQAVAALWDMVHSNDPISSKARTILQMDNILGLGLDQYLGKQLEIPPSVSKLVAKREKARQSGNFKISDDIRKEVQDLGFDIEDTSSGPRVKSLK